MDGDGNTPVTQGRGGGHLGAERKQVAAAPHRGKQGGADWGAAQRSGYQVPAAYLREGRTNETERLAEPSTQTSRIFDQEAKSAASLSLASSNCTPTTWDKAGTNRP